MATASASTQTGPGSTPRSRPVSLWRRPLLVGVCVALGYGLTQRLLDLRLPALVRWGQTFEPRDRPGTSLDSLRLRFGSEQQELRGRLDLQELESQQPAAEVPADAQAADQAMPPVAPPLPDAEPPAETRPPAESLPAPRQP